MSMPVLTQSRASKINREASFSSFLDGGGEEGGAATTQGFTPSITTPHDRIPFADDKEIDVFGAEKYFNGGLSFSPNKVCTNSLSTHKHQEDDQNQTLAIKKQQQPPIAALSNRFESSLNSRSALLRNDASRNRANKKSFLASIGCADKNSVDIDNCSVNQTNDQPEQRVTRFNIPCLSFRAGNTTAKQEKIGASKRRSRVFRSPITNAKNKATMATWEAIAEDLKIPSVSREMHNDGGSDASSDLFEIDESLYKDNTSMTPTTCYAPSEASVEWSVVTASAADFSILSDSEEVTSSVSKRAGVGSKTKEMPKIRPSFLAGCKSHKAVSIAGDAHAKTPMMTRFHDESKLSFDAKTRQNSLDARFITQPRSASAAHLLYTW